MENKIVSIWAPLRYANYGDDMQAIAFAQMIKGMGYGVKVFQLDESLAAIYGIEVASTVDELCKDVNLVIIAGGALLTPFRWYKRILNKAAREYEADFRDLYRATVRHPNVKFCAVSFGGDGRVKRPDTWFSHWRIDFFRSPSFINGTVRLKGDVDMMKLFGKNMEYYPDILFRVCDYFQPDVLPPTGKYRVGFNFKRGRYLDKKLIRNILDYAATHNDMEFHFTTTHMPKIGLDYQYVPAVASNNVFIDRYETPCQLLGVLASMDCFMTSMLHVGLTGLMAGTPFVSYRGPGKTKSFLNSIGGDWAILPENITFEQLREQFWNKRREELYSLYDTAEIERMKKESLRQYEFCRNVVERYA